MQRIYPTGIGEISLEDGWEAIAKEENFRCPTSVLAVANAIRRDGDDLVQTGGRTHKNLDTGEDVPVGGSAQIFVLPADGMRDERLAAVRQLVSGRLADPAWVDGQDADYKLLVIVHRMAANRLGFGELYASMNDKAPSYFSDGFLDATSWPIKPFESFVLPMVEALEAGNEFSAMSLLRKYCPRLERSSLANTSVAKLLASLRSSVIHLAELMSNPTATVLDVLRHIVENDLMVLEPRLSSYLSQPVAQTAGDADGGEAGLEEDGEAISIEISAMDRYLLCPAIQFRGYRTYVQQLSPFSTQQGIKGAEFERVLVVLDDDEGTHVQFSYDKYFGTKPLSKRDKENQLEGKPTTVDRTRRLFYVCCTRALKDLVVVYFSDDPHVAERNVRATGIFPDDMVFGASALL